MKYKLFSSFFLVVFLGISAMAQIFTNYTSVQGLADNYVSGGVAIDASGNKWFGTTAGLSKFNNTTWTTYTTTDGMVSNYVNSVETDASGNIWIGTDNGVSKFNGSTWINYTTAQGLIDNAVYCILAASDGSIWFGTYSGISKLNGSTWTNYTTSDGLSSNTITCIAEDNSGNIWFGTMTGGVAVYNGTTFSSITSTQGLPDDNVFSIAMDASDNKYIGTWYGVTVLNSSNSVDTTYVSPASLYNNFVRDIIFDNNGILWVGVFADYNLDGAVTRFDGTNWHSMSAGSGLVDMQIKQLAVDNDNSIWVATGNGVCKIEYHTSIAENNANDINVFPNPASDFIELKGVEAGSSIRIYDINGREVISCKVESNKAISISKLHAGVYTVRITSNSEVHNTTLVVR